MVKAFPIQAATLPSTLAGRDVLGRGKTGSGKTLAFALPLVARLAESARTSGRERSRPRGLVLAPTRELANQISAAIEPLAKAAGLKQTTIFGGVAQGKQVKALQDGVDILVACPGRLEDLMGQRLVSLASVEITVLDEADHMADLGFLPGVKRLLDATPHSGQRLLFSATLDRGVDVLVKRYLDRPLTHSVDSESSPVTAMTHYVFTMADSADKKAVVQHLASGLGRRVFFTRTKHTAKKLARALTASGIPAVDLQGNLSQPARERNLAAFSSGTAKVMVATDIAARGIHVDDVDLVVHVDPPTEHKAYLHRSGRTARAGSGGDVVTLVLPPERRDVQTMLRHAKISAELIQVTPQSDVIADLVGEVAAHVEPAPVAAPQQNQPRGNSRNGRNSRGGGRGATRTGTSGNGRTAGHSGREGERRTDATRQGEARGDRRGTSSGQRASAGGGRGPASYRTESSPRPARGNGRGRSGTR
ncbi:DEAD/DEAH box helicase [Saxibacter everestensis]|uniref:DEAD/DEAH box helicase n=2 Tax=Saxibacter everestensis TaxID=2909229 RepID=A0ABY8R0T6_9MICO|nr:DEAD/DEAH box helicase [Brevibacteriaceae bacterium ZFBP1038]